MNKKLSSSQKLYNEYVNLPIIVAIYELTKGEFPYETSQDYKENFKQNIHKNSE